MIDFVQVMDTPTSRLQYLIDNKGISYQELADEIGVDNSLVSKYLNPKHKPSAPFLEKLEDTYGWSVRWIRTGQGPQLVTNVKSNNNITQQGSWNRNTASIGNTDIDAELIKLETENKMLREQVELLKDLLKNKQ